MIKYIWSHKKRFCWFIVFFVLFMILFYTCADIKNIDINCDEQIILILGITLQNWGTILAIFFGLVTFFWAMFEYDKRRIMEQQQRASDIAKIFSDEIVEKLFLISTILTENSKFRELCKKIDPNRIKRFDKFELKEILEDFNDDSKDSKTNIYISEINQIISAEKTQKEYENLLNDLYDDENKNRFPKKYTWLIQTTLNKLEYLCIDISSNAAGTQFIYGSLHQLFLKTIHLLYTKIAYKNTNIIDKHYINVIEVYNIWNEEKQKNIFKSKKMDKKISKMEIRINKLDKKLKKEIHKLLSIKTETI